MWPHKFVFSDRERETQTPQRGDKYLFYPYFSSDRNLGFVRNYYLNAIEGGHTHMLLQETGAKGHSADIYLQGYMPALYLSSVFSSV